MRSEYLQTLRYKLQKRVSRVKCSGWQQYILALRHFWTFFDSEPTLAAVAEDLLSRFPDALKLADQIPKGPFPSADDEGEWAAVAYSILRRFAKEDDSRAVKQFVPNQSSSNFDDYLSAFNAFYLDPFY